MSIFCQSSEQDGPGAGGSSGRVGRDMGAHLQEGHTPFTRVKWLSQGAKWPQVQGPPGRGSITRVLLLGPRALEGQ